MVMRCADSYRRATLKHDAPCPPSFINSSTDTLAFHCLHHINSHKLDSSEMVNKAVRVTQANGAVVESQSKPFSASDLEANEVLIKNVAVASNPKDWKLAPLGMYEGIEGNDVAGYIEAVGSDVKDFKKGDKVSCTT